MEEISSEDPLRGYKRAWITVGKKGALMFRGVIGATYLAEAEAACRRPGYQSGPRARIPKPHAFSPALDCTCGFYAWKSPDLMRKYYCISHASVALEVDLYGTIVVCERGFKAQYQRVLRVTVGDRCMYCRKQPRFFAPVKADPQLRPVCGTCRPSRERSLVPIREIAGLLGTEVAYQLPERVQAEPFYKSEP